MKTSFLTNNINIHNPYFLTSRQAPVKKEQILHGHNKYSEIEKREYYNAIKNHIIPFLGKIKSTDETQEAVYVIDVLKNYKRFDNIDDASETLKISKNKILKCIKGDCEQVDGLVFAPASIIEEKNKRSISVDDFMLEMSANILKELQNPIKPFITLNEILKIPEEKNDKITRVRDIPDEDIQNSKKKSFSNPFYIMDELGGYKKFYSQVHVANALKTDRSAINNCIKGKKTINHFALISASEIETKPKGTKALYIDLEKLKSRFKKKSKFYAMDATGECREFYLPREASKALGISEDCILNCLAKKQKTSGGYAFARAEELEIKNPDGSIEIDNKKINELKKNLQEKAIYLIDSQGYTRYDDDIAASKDIGASYKLILKCLSGERKKVYGYAVVRANEVERFDENGKCILNKRKLQEIFLEAQKPDKTYISENGFYSIDRNRKRQKFYKLKESEKELGIRGAEIGNCLKGKSYFVKDYVFAQAEEIEIKKADGTIEFDEIKITQKMRNFEKDAFYAIDTDGNAEYFLNLNKATEKFKGAKTSISTCLAGKSKTTRNRILARPEEIEIYNKDGSISLNQTVIKRLVKELREELSKFELYAIDASAKPKKFSSRTEASEKLNVKREHIYACLQGKRKSANGYVFASACEIGTIKEDGEIEFDEEKIKEKIKVLKI